jgi:16S rRNA (adenine1518-N6/adenine1519-N6)-dimethyltransferase
LEIGPGLGILTEKLAERAGYVLAVEKDSRLAGILKEKFISQKNVEILEGDILKINLPEKLKAYKVVANIPYYLTSYLIRQLLESKNPPKEMILIIQKEVAERICAQPPKMSLLSVAVQFYAQAEIFAFVSKKSFWPQPKVDSAIIKITPHKNPSRFGKGTDADFEKNFFSVVRAGFSQPRKQLANNLSHGLKIDKEKIGAALKKIGSLPEHRAETLNLKQWIALTKLLFLKSKNSYLFYKNK